MKKIYILVLVIAFSLLSACMHQPPSQEQPPVVQETPPVQSVSLIIDEGTDQPLTFEQEFQPDMSVLDLIQHTDLLLQTKVYDFGTLIEAIGDTANGQDDKYWLYYVNDEMPMVSVDNYKLNPGDKVEFRFEASAF